MPDRSRSARIRRTSSSTAGGCTGGGSKTTHGASNSSTRSYARQQPGHRGLSPAHQHGHLGVGRDRTHRTTGQQDVAHAVQSGQQNLATTSGPRGPHHPRHELVPRLIRTASPSVGATVASRPARSISALRVSGVGTRTARAPAARAASTSAPMSPITTHSFGCSPSSRAAAWTRPGAGFRQAQPSSTPCGQTCQVSNGPSRSSTRALTRCQRLGTDQSASHPGLIADHADRNAAPAQVAEHAAGARHRADARRVGQVGHVGDQGAVAVEQDGLGPIVAAGRRAPGRRTLHSPRSRW